MRMSSPEMLRQIQGNKNQKEQTSPHLIFDVRKQKLCPTQDPDSRPSWQVCNGPHTVGRAWAGCFSLWPQAPRHLRSLELWNRSMFDPVYTFLGMSDSHTMSKNAPVVPYYPWPGGQTRHCGQCFFLLAWLNLRCFLSKSAQSKSNLPRATKGTWGCSSGYPWGLHGITMYLASLHPTIHRTASEGIACVAPKSPCQMQSWVRLNVQVADMGCFPIWDMS